MTKQFHHIKLLLQRLSIVLLIYILCRVIFYLFNTQAFSSVSAGNLFLLSLYGLRFDISAILYINLLFIALHLLPLPQRDTPEYQLLLKVVFYIPNSAALLLSVADFEYFKYSLKRSAADVAGFSFDIFNLLPQFIIDYWGLFLLFSALLAFMEFLYRKTAIRQFNKARANYPLQFFLLVLFTGITIIGARGGLQKKPITPITSLQYVDVSVSALVTNTPFQFIHSFSQARPLPKQYFPEAALNNEFRFCRKTDFHDSTIVPLPRARDNIVILILESFSQEYMGIYGAQKSSTPFLDSLGKNGLVYKNMFANGTRSVEGIPAICASIPSLMDGNFIYSIYQTNKIDGIGNLLKKTGYSTAFFHGGINGTFNFDSFSRLAGFDNYFGKNEYNNEKDFDGNWGIYDGPFFQFTAEKLSEMNAPFCAVLFSLSSHHPYLIPEDRKQQFDSIKEPFRRSLRYTDFSLQQFFETASQSKWFENTLFVITADHKGPALNDYSYTWTGQYGIPLILFKHNSAIKGSADFVVQQADIVPGILDYTGYPYPFCSFGESVFRNAQQRYVYQYMSGTSQIIDRNYILHFDGNNAVAMYKHVKWQHPEPILKDTLPLEQERLEKRLKTILQIYNSALVKNQMSFSGESAYPTYPALK